MSNGRPPYQSAATISAAPVLNPAVMAASAAMPALTMCMTILTIALMPVSQVGPRNTATTGGGISNAVDVVSGTLTTTGSWKGTTCGNTVDDFKAVKGIAYTGQTAGNC